MGDLVYRDFEVHGVTYTTVADAAEALGLSVCRVRAALRNGETATLGVQKVPVTVHGVTYPSYSDAGRALGLAANTIRHAHKNGTLHRVGCGRRGPEPMRIKIGDAEFESAAEAARHFKCRPMTILSAVADGDPERVARARRYNPWKSKPFQIGDLRFPSMRQASRALGFESEEFIAKALKRGSKKGYERIVAAAMTYSQQHGGGA